jgi:hypothetical protein
MSNQMAGRDNLALLPGGFEEATLFKRNAYRVFIKERKGAYSGRVPSNGSA